MKPQYIPNILNTPELWPADLRRTGAVLLSVLFALGLRWIWPTPLVYDDGGIVLRYMDNFAAGGFYRYNLTGEPVFGLSGFVHGIFAGFLAYTHVLTPDASVIFSNAVGLAVTTLALLMILSRYTRTLAELLIAWILTLAAADYFIRVSYQGLETPLHVGIVLMACWAFLADHRRRFWMLCALAVVSKLDAVPVVSLLLVLRSLRVLGSQPGKAALLEELGAACGLFCLPLAAWLFYATAVFGSPMPQSAYAKVSLHAHPAGQLAFAQKWWRHESPRLVGYLLLAVAGLVAAVARRDWHTSSRLLLFPGASLAVLALYCVYNPGERMPWYYALPQLLMIVGAVVSVLELRRSLEDRPGRWWQIALGAGPSVVMALLLLPALHGTRAVLAGDYLAIMGKEPVRIALGQYVRAHAAPGDSLYTGHGHIARHAGIDVVDYSGLNSPEVTRMREAGQGPLRILRPRWVTRPAMIMALGQNELGYTLAATFYDRTLRGGEAWRVWRRRDPRDRRDFVRRLAVAEVAEGVKIRPVGNGVLSITVDRRTVWTSSSGAAVTRVSFGVARQEHEFTLEVGGAGAGKGRPKPPSRRYCVPALDPADLVRGRTHEIHYTLPATETASLAVAIVDGEASPPPEPVVLLEPVWVEARR